MRPSSSTTAKGWAEPTISPAKLAILALAGTFGQSAPALLTGFMMERAEITLARSTSRVNSAT